MEMSLWYQMVFSPLQISSHIMRPHATGNSLQTIRGRRMQVGNSIIIFSSFELPKRF
jgi:hypothetical protein